MSTRTHEVKIRLTEAEFQKLQDLKTKPKLAVWLRELALSQQASSHPQDRLALIYEMNRIETRLNEIVRFIHLNPSDLSKDFLHLIEGMQDKLRAVLDDC